jgi:hypothetical protein
MIARAGVYSRIWEGECSGSKRPIKIFIDSLDLGEKSMSKSI